MGNKITIPFEAINPFIRHVHFSGIEPFIHSTLLKAYDYRLIYIYGGKGYIIIDNTKYNVQKGDLFIWKPGTEYFIFSDTVDNMIIVGVNFDFTQNKSYLDYPIPPEKSSEFKEDKIVECVDFSDIKVFNNPVFINDAQVYESLLIQMNNEYVAKKKFYPLVLSGLFLSIIGGLARRIYSPAVSSKTTKIIDNIIQYIQENYHLPIKNRHIGQKINYHPNYINKLMIIHTGFSLHQYLIDFRISKAIDLMQTTNKTISEIALLVGFKDINYFSKAFKRKTGKSPRNYIRQFIENK